MTPDPTEITPHELLDLRVEQAKLLRANARSSAIAVLVLIGNCTVLLLLSGHGWPVLIWAASALLMVATTIFYARSFKGSELTQSTTPAYLRGHNVITSITGLVWSFGPIFLIDQASLFSVIICALLPLSITLGGLFPSSIYRPAFVALGVTALLPFGFFLIFTGALPIKFFGLGVLIYFGFGMFSSVKTELAMHDTLRARLRNASFAEIEQKNEQVELLLEENARFVAAVSHDLNQPVIAAGNFISLLRQTNLTPEQSDLVDKLDLTRQSQETLFAELLEHSANTKNEITPIFKDLYLSEVLAPIVYEFETVAKGRGLAFTVEIGDQCVHSDQTALSRIMRNILSNAMNYTPSGGQVILRTLADEDCTRICIIDDGPGIPENEQKRVFEERVRLDNGKHRSGQGLGLHISRKLASAIGSHLNLKSQLGVGTEVTITLDKSCTVRNKQLHSVLVIGPTRHKLYGEWVPLLSGWKMPAMVAENVEEAATMITVLKHAPEIIILCETSVPKGSSPRREVDALVGKFEQKPMIYLNATPENARLIAKDLRSAGYDVMQRPDTQNTSELKNALRSAIEDLYPCENSLNEHQSIGARPNGCLQSPALKPFERTQHDC